MMEYKPEEYDNQRLLELLRGAFQDWKRIEDICSKQSKVYVRQNNYQHHAELLKDTYLSLLREARNRKLSLTSRELVNSILNLEHSKKRK